MRKIFPFIQYCLQQISLGVKNPVKFCQLIKATARRAGCRVLNFPYKVYLRIVFPSWNWHRHFRHDINEYSATSAWPDAQQQHQNLMQHLPSVCKNILDLGCGDGWSSNYLYSEHGFEVVGFTCNPNELRHARRNYPKVLFKFGDMHNLPFRGRTFDAVYCRECYEHSIAPYIALSEMHRVIKRGGYLLLNIPDERWIEDPSHYSVMTRCQMMAMFRKCKFELVKEGRTPAGHFWYLVKKYMRVCT